MNLLEELTAEHREMIVSLPYRVGLWVSQSDRAGGEWSAAHELQVLSDIIEGFAGEVFGSELVQYIMSGTLARRREWPKWSAETESVLADCRLAVGILHTHTDGKDITAFKARLLEIAEAVAGAFHEHEEATAGEKIRLYIRYYVERMRAVIQKTPYQSLDKFLGVSRHERSALEALTQALSI